MRTRRNRPKLDVSISPTERVLGLVAAAGVLLSVLIVLNHWADLPARIPTHFGPSGRPDAWGPKWSLLALTGLTIALFAGLTIARRFPHTYNYPWRITEENAPRQYALARSLLAWINLEVVSLFTYLQWSTIQVALGNSEGLGAWLLSAVLIALFATIAIYFLRAYRAR
jgi:uncharacterized membrane protein